MTTKEKHPILNSNSNVQGYQRIPRQPKRPSRSLHISISLIILALFILYANRNGRGGLRPSYEAGGKRLPETYGICSKEGNKVYTVPDDGDGVGGVECVVVSGKTVVDTGSLAKIRRNWGDKATIGGVDQSPDAVRKAGGLRILFLPPGHSMTPGLIDAHGHPLQYGYFSQLPLAGSNSVAEVIHRVEDFVKHNASSLPEGAWIEGMGWDQNKWESKEFPLAADLDGSPVLKGLKIALSRIDIHAEWVAPAILALLPELPDHVDGGQIVRDSKGQPTGVFIDNAIRLLDPIRPVRTDAQREIYLKRVTEDALSKGMTGVHDAAVTPAEISFYRRMADKGKLGIRVYAMLQCGETAPYCGDQVERVLGAGDGKFTLQAVKLFGDGALGSRGAALIDDYTDQPGWNGFLLRPEEDWKPLIQEWYEKGWQVNVHTIGDKANLIVIDAMEAVVGADLVVGRERRLRLEHAQIMRPEDIRRAVRLGVIGSYQPTHATSDMWYAEDRLGAERLRGAYAWQTYTSLGGRIALGSDFPVESIDPLKGFYAAVTRLSETGTSPHGSEGWYASEKLTREQALRGFTVDAAYAGFSNDTGGLTIGKRFDAVIWDDDLMTVDQDEMLQVKVKATFMDGQLVWGRFQQEA